MTSIFIWIFLRFPLESRNWTNFYRQQCKNEREENEKFSLYCVDSSTSYLPEEKLIWMGIRRRRSREFYNFSSFDIFNIFLSSSSSIISQSRVQMHFFFYSFVVDSPAKFSVVCFVLELQYDLTEQHAASKQEIIVHRKQQKFNENFPHTFSCMKSIISVSHESRGKFPSLLSHFHDFHVFVCNSARCLFKKSASACLTHTSIFAQLQRRRLQRELILWKSLGGGRLAHSLCRLLSAISIDSSAVESEYVKNRRRRMQFSLLFIFHNISSSSCSSTPSCFFFFVSHFRISKEKIIFHFSSIFSVHWSRESSWVNSQVSYTVSPSFILCCILQIQLENHLRLTDGSGCIDDDDGKLDIILKMKIKTFPLISKSCMHFSYSICTRRWMRKNQKCLRSRKMLFTRFFTRDNV